MIGWPTVLEKASRALLGGAAAAFDRAVHATAISRPHKRGPRVRTTEEAVTWLHAVSEQYQEAGADAGFFRDPERITPRERIRKRTLEGQHVIDLSWPSNYEPFLPEIRDSYLRYANNRTAAARLVTQTPPRPVAVLVHGYLGGVHRVERRVWPLDFFRRIGMDVVLFVLPFHGTRAEGQGFGQVPPFPGSDPRVTNEGFRQAMGELRDLVRWLLERGHPQVGVMGMSLGGFTSSLLATVEPELAFAVPIIPLASIADMALRQGRLGDSPERARAVLKALEPIYALTSPLHRPSVIPARSILVIGGERDQITPITHARMLATHFGCRIETWPGGHLLQVGRAEKFRSIGRFLNELGIVERG